jgi:hypothetical protein
MRWLRWFVLNKLESQRHNYDTVSLVWILALQCVLPGWVMVRASRLSRQAVLPGFWLKWPMLGGEGETK